MDNGGIAKWQGSGLQSRYYPVRLRMPPPKYLLELSCLRTVQVIKKGRLVILPFLFKKIESLKSGGGKLIFKDLFYTNGVRLWKTEKSR